MTVLRIPKPAVRGTREVVVSLAPAPANDHPQPRKPSLLDPKFKYVPASQTNVARTFARIRRELAAKEKA